MLLKSLATRLWRLSSRSNASVKSINRPLFSFQAENASPVTTVDLSDDGLKICAGTESGTISLLDIVSHTHETLLRSHTDAVNCVSLLPSCSALQNSNPVFLTGSSDGTMRQWVLTQNAILSNPPLNESDVLEPYLLGNISENTEDSNFQQYGATACCQSYEFRCPTDKVMSIAASHEGKRIAAGFASSWIRVFDTEEATIITAKHPSQDQHHHCWHRSFSSLAVLW